MEGEVRGRNPTNKMARGGRAGGRGNPRPPTDSLGGQAPHSVPPSFPLSRWRRRRFKIAVFAPLWNWGRGARCRSRMEWSGARLGQNVKMLSNPFLRPLSPLPRLLKAVFVLFRKSSIPNHPPPAPNSIQFRVGYRRDGTRVQDDSCNQILRLMRRGEERSAHIRGPRPTDQQIIVLPSFPFRPSKPFLPSSVCAAAASSSCSPPPSVVLLPTYLLPSCGARVSDLFTLRRARQEGEAQRGSEEAHLKVAITATAAAAVHPLAPVRAHLILSLPSPSGWSPSPRPPREIRRNSLKKRLEPLRSRIDGMGRVGGSLGGGGGRVRVLG